MKRFTGKTGKIYDYLKNNDGITSIQAFEMFGATRLSAIIFNLKKYGCEIDSEKCVGKDRYGTTVKFARYKLIGEKS